MNKVAAAIIIVLLAYSTPANSQMTAKVIADSLFIPWELIYAPDNHIWFTQKNGYICRVNPGTGVVDTLYHETNTVIQNEGGMLGMVLHPNFPADPYVYVAYNYSQGGYKERIVRYTYSGTQLSSPTTLLDNIAAGSIHNGCRMVIVSNQLYITTGEVGNTSLAQNINSLNGKTLRINLDGTIPADNPFPGSPVWSWGHRNAQGLVYANSRFYSSEHGPSNDDELNILMKGRNYGWPNVQGFCNTAQEMSFCNDSNVVEPLIAWTPTLAVGAIAYYNHPMFPQLQNSLLMTTLKNAKLHQLQLNSTFDQVADTHVIGLVSGERLRGICIDPDGRIYISTSKSVSSGTGSKIDKIIEISDPSYSSIAKTLRKENKQFAVYPNPASNEVNIYANVSPGKDTYTYSINNTTGQSMFTGNIRAGNNTIPLSGIAAGAYTIIVYKDGGITGVHKIQKL